jgi:cyclophilin family peptidyl-prolyl cis-trans isomerase
MEKSAIIVMVLVLILAAVFGFVSKGRTTGQTTMTDEIKIKLETTKGDIIIKLYPDKAPITVKNFLDYVNSGFYEGTIFHRVIEGFMVQGGGYASDGKEKQTNHAIKLESNNGLKNTRGTIAMARTNVPDSATSQFFINTADNDFLNYGVRDRGYAVFGEVIEGMDVVDEIGSVATDASDRPLEEVKILKAEII